MGSCTSYIQVGNAKPLDIFKHKCISRCFKPCSFRGLKTVLGGLKGLQPGLILGDVTALGVNRAALMESTNRWNEAAKAPELQGGNGGVESPMNLHFTVWHDSIKLLFYFNVQKKSPLATSFQG